MFTAKRTPPITTLEANRWVGMEMLASSLLCFTRCVCKSELVMSRVRPAALQDLISEFRVHALAAIFLRLHLLGNAVTVALETTHLHGIPFTEDLRILCIASADVRPR